ncbi:GDP dissociation inhibitor-domain-containing protein [Crucibulum laeve]|uniref:GDP dissociation inhibitor-domain-containing protein n=1 Tax=Crucibulum laeve TaxID=68775 RepID=A0A5C3MDE3_9AGAR|nr:GDP dissociation inhibitor-domain-containing protein [Crucibulum laeve]
MEDGNFDVIIIGTGLTESITAAALSKAGFKVAHLDENPYYGGNEASLSLEELAQWACKHSSSSEPVARFTSVTRSADIPSYARQYSICLCPSVIPSIGPFISALVASGVSKYTGFRLLESAAVYDSSGTLKNVPGSKEDVFKNKDISLIEKRRLMRFLTFSAGDFEDTKELEGSQQLPFLQFLQEVFSLSEEISSVIAYSLAYCVSVDDATLPALQRLRRYMHSIGRYGPSPFLVGHYGGIGDIAQGFCRAAAVSGGVYILGRKILSVTPQDSSPSTDNSVHDTSLPGYTITLDDFPEPLTCKIIISSTSNIHPDLISDSQPTGAMQDVDLNTTSVARCIAIIDKPISFAAVPSTDDAEDIESNDESTESSRRASGRDMDTAVLVFPPSSLPRGSRTSAATVLLNGEGSLSAPKGKWILYIGLPVLSSTTVKPEDILRPYLDAVLTLAHDAEHPPKPLFTTFYMENPSRATQSPDVDSSSYLVVPQADISALPDRPDIMTEHAETVFQMAVRMLRRETSSAMGDGDVESSLKQDFWPPLPDDEAESQEW